VPREQLAAEETEEAATLESVVRCSNLRCYHSGCNDVSKARTPDCVAAESRFCSDRGGFGFGLSQDIGNGVIGTACANAWRSEVSLFELSQLHPGCNVNWKSQHPDCVAAAHRYCRSRGYGAGVAQEVGLSSLGIACIHTGLEGDAPISELSHGHPGCSSSASSQSNDCASAARRYCIARGFTAGLAQEVGPSSIGVGCFNPVAYLDAPINPVIF
jgi:hypothetical protein